MSKTNDTGDNIQEYLNKLEKDLYEKNKLVDELKEKLYIAQEERFKSHTELSKAKEQYLLSVISVLKNKNKE